MVERKKISEEENKSLTSTSKFSQNDKSILNKKITNVKTTNDQIADSTKTNTTKAFEAVEEIILKLADKMFVDKWLNKESTSIKEVEKNEMANLNKKSVVNVVQKRKPVSVYLAPIENIKPISNLKSMYVDETLNENSQNRDINLLNNNYYTSIEKSQSYENLNCGTLKGKKKTIFLPITNDAYSLDLTPPSSISPDNSNKKSSNHKINSGMHADTTIPPLSTKNMPIKQNSEHVSLISNKISTSEKKQNLASISTDSTTTALEIVKNEPKKSKCESKLNKDDSDIDKSFEEAYEEEYRNCPECSSPKQHKRRRRQKKDSFSKERISEVKRLNLNTSSNKVGNNYSIPRKSKCLTASSFTNSRNSPQKSKTTKHYNDNIYTVAPTRNRNRNMDNDSGIDNPLFNDDVSVFPYTCKVTANKTNFIPSINILPHQISKVQVPLRNHVMKSKDLNINEENLQPMIKIESPKIAKFYDMQLFYNDKKQQQRCEKNSLKHLDEKSFEIEKSVNDLAAKNTISVSSSKERKISPENIKSTSVKSSLNTFSTASNGGIDNTSRLAKKSSSFRLNTAIANESEDVITDSFVPYHLRNFSKSQTKVNRYNDKNNSNKLECTSEIFPSGMIIVFDDDKGNRVTVNITNIIKSFSNNNETLSPYAIYMNGNPIWKK